MRRAVLLLVVLWAAWLGVVLWATGCSVATFPPVYFGDDLAVMDMAPGSDLVPFVDVTPRPDLWRPDAGAGWWCTQSLGDGGRDALAPGAPCSLGGADRCALPVVCSFEAADLDSACLPGAPRDGGVDYRCCQMATTHNQLTGAAENCRNCGDGWSCG